MSFCLFAVFSEAFGKIDDLASRVTGLQQMYVYTPEQTHDPFLDDGSPPPLVLQLYFPSQPELEAACDGPLQILQGRCEVDAMLVCRFAVPEFKPPGCTYLVAYEGTAEDENAWHAHYLQHHPALMARLPEIRELEIYTPVTWASNAGWRRKHCMQRNKVAFDNAEALTTALNSPVRREMRANYLTLPSFSGRVTHYAMATRVVRSRQ